MKRRIQPHKGRNHGLCRLTAASARALLWEKPWLGQETLKKDRLTKGGKTWYLMRAEIGSWEAL
jgi:hypothetical protein